MSRRSSLIVFGVCVSGLVIAGAVKNASAQVRRGPPVRPACCCPSDEPATLAELRVQAALTIGDPSLSATEKSLILLELNARAEKRATDLGLFYTGMPSS